MTAPAHEPRQDAYYCLSLARKVSSAIHVAIDHDVTWGLDASIGYDHTWLTSCAREAVVDLEYLVDDVSGEDLRNARDAAHALADELTNTRALVHDYNQEVRGVKNLALYLNEAHAQTIEICHILDELGQGDTTVQNTEQHPARERVRRKVTAAGRRIINWWRRWRERE